MQNKILRVIKILRSQDHRMQGYHQKTQSYFTDPEQLTKKEQESVPKKEATLFL